MTENFDAAQQERLTGNLSDLYKLRIGNYHMLYQPLENKNVLIIHQIGHRRKICK
ncbi:MAG: type II toxin-antitoxin system RelE/ParE family toxin [Chloroflexi bacterium]|nr:type II toxin-antitoxin system RelE/ParE family toxin [Chloroflexota bacterium]